MGSAERVVYSTNPQEMDLAMGLLLNPAKAQQMMTLDEMSRVIDLLENPPSSGPMLDIVSQYKGPKNFAAVRKEIEFYECSQDMEEFNLMLEVIRGKHSLLEIGSRFGGTLRRMASVLAPNSLVVSVDFPMIDGTHHAFNPLGSLKSNCKKIADMGHHVELIIFDSHSPQVIADVKALGPFDFGFIDADHSYEGAKEDYENYGPMCKMLGFHDIINQESLIRLWGELKEKYTYSEFINRSSTVGQLGIGILHMEHPK